MKSKSEIRKEHLKRRRELSPEHVSNLSHRIIEKIRQHEIYKHARQICLYMPIKNEVDMHPLLAAAWMEQKEVYLPRIVAGDMDFYLYDESTPLISGAYDILEPASKQVLIPTNETLVICPGAVFSYQGDRIGYGGGYYDKYLAKHPMVSAMAVAYEFQIHPDIPHDSMDRKMDYVISEENIYVKGEKP